MFEACLSDGLDPTRSALSIVSLRAFDRFAVDHAVRRADLTLFGLSGRHDWRALDAVLRPIVAAAWNADPLRFATDMIGRLSRRSPVPSSALMVCIAKPTREDRNQNLPTNAAARSGDVRLLSRELGSNLVDDGLSERVGEELATARFLELLLQVLHPVVATLKRCIVDRYPL